MPWREEGFGEIVPSGFYWQDYSFYTWLEVPYPYLTVVLFLSYRAVYASIGGKQKIKKPFPYDHFIALEQNRMMRFYRFANYFTDVPHLKGSVSRRGWLGFLFGHAKIRTKPFHKRILSGGHLFGQMIFSGYG